MDHNYHESMFSMFKRINGICQFELTVNMMLVQGFSWGILTSMYLLIFGNVLAKEYVVGWYSTCPKLRENDLDIHRLLHK